MWITLTGSKKKCSLKGADVAAGLVGKEQRHVISTRWTAERDGAAVGQSASQGSSLRASALVIFLHRLGIRPNHL